ncbi:MAG: hypothetical protein POELPBGB_02990 [Bacteroidia bacterium]|nr:hypothetical protein [Bacteroidia bacterium]
MKTIKTTLIAALLLFTVNASQAQEAKEYVTVSILVGGGYNGYVIAYPDATTEKGALTGAPNVKNLEPNAITMNEIFNKLSKKGYKLVSSNGGYDTGVQNLFYIFEK